MNYRVDSKRCNESDTSDSINKYSRIIFMLGIIPCVINRNNKGKARIKVSTLQTLPQFNKELTASEVNNCLAFLQKRRVINILNKSNNIIDIELLFVAHS